MDGPVRTIGRWAGVVSIAAGIGNPAVWTGWSLQADLRQPGLAIPEVAGALFVGLWVLHTAGYQSTGRQPNVSAPD